MKHMRAVSESFAKLRQILSPHANGIARLREDSWEAEVLRVRALKHVCSVCAQRHKGAPGGSFE